MFNNSQQVTFGEKKSVQFIDMFIINIDIGSNSSLAIIPASTKCCWPPYLLLHCSRPNISNV